MQKSANTQRQLQQSAQMERDDHLELFIRVVNLVEPEHKYDILYPLSPSRVEFSYCTRYWAKCGPRHGGAYYAVNMDYMKKQHTERVLAVVTHEIAHLQYGVTKGKSTHPPSFWRAMAFYATELRDNWETVESWFDHRVSVAKYLRSVVKDPNSSTVDRRSETVNERRNKMAQLVGLDPKDVL